MAGLTADDYIYNERLMRRISERFRHYVKPKIVLCIFHKYDVNVLTKQDIEKVEAETANAGDISGATILLEKLPFYEDWFPCLMKVLRDSHVKLGHVADAMERDAAELHAKLQSEQQCLQSYQTYVLNGKGELESGEMYDRSDQTYYKMVSPVSSSPSSVQDSNLQAETDMSGLGSHDGCLVKTASGGPQYPKLSESGFFGFSSTKMNQDCNFSPNLTDFDAEFRDKTNMTDFESSTPEIPTHKEGFENDEDYDYCSDDSSDSFEVLEKGGEQQEEKDEPEGFHMIHHDLKFFPANNLYEYNAKGSITHESLLQESSPRSYEQDANDETPNSHGSSFIPKEGGQLTGIKHPHPKEQLKNYKRYGGESDFGREDVARSLDGFDGWHPDISEREISETLKSYGSEDGHYLLCYWERKKRPVLCVTYEGTILPFIVHRRLEQDGCDHSESFYIYKTAKTARTLRDIVNYHLKNGVTTPEGKTISFQHPVPLK